MVKRTPTECQISYYLSKVLKERKKEVLLISNISSQSRLLISTIKCLLQFTLANKLQQGGCHKTN